MPFLEKQGARIFYREAASVRRPLMLSRPAEFRRAADLFLDTFPPPALE